MTSEAAVQQHTRIAHCERTNGQIWRNNSGAMTDETGRVVRYGLGNDSAQLNKQIKSSDLIGITPEYVWHPVRGWVLLGVFTAYECKPSGWIMRPGDDRALAQAKFHDIVRAAGGYAGFVTDPRDIERIIARV